MYLTIGSRSDANALREGQFTHIISLRDLRTAVPAGVVRRERDTSVLTLAFDDEHDAGSVSGPKLSHILTILDFASRIGERDRLFVHCEAGIARSTAAAYAALCARSPYEAEWECLAAVRRIRPQAQPNPVMVQMADYVLRRNGRMTAALKSTSGS